MKKTSLELSVIVPVYNEPHTIATLLRRVFASLPPGSEVVVVDDGSTDQTPAILRRFAAHARVRLFSLPRNFGKGYAVRFGLKQAKGEILLIQDADLEYDPADYPRLLKPIREGLTEVVYGSRLATIPLSFKTLRSIPLPLHFVANRFLSFVTNLLYGSQLTDMETCYKVFTRKVLRSIQLTRDGFDIEAELTAKILRSGFTILEVPIKTKPRSYREGKKITWKDGVWALLTLLRYRLDAYHLAMVGVFVLAIFFRFYDFSNRYGLWSDQARDAFVGRVSVLQGRLPLIGSFSSAGPFTFGPYWYWYSALMSLLVASHMGYWIGMGFASLLMIAVLMWIARAVGGRLMNLAVGVFAAVSFAQLQSSLGSTQHSMVAVFVTLFMAATLVTLKQGKPYQFFLTAFLLGMAINFHYQAVYLIPMLGIVLVSGKFSFRSLFAAGLGLALPFLPLLIFDWQHDWWNTRQIIDYYRFGQYRVYVPNRWLTYAGVFWPSYWTKTVGGHLLFSYLTMVGIGLVFVFRLVKRDLAKSLLVFGLGFLGAIIGFRYFRGERFEGYLVFSQPLILLFTGWLVSLIARRNLRIGLLVFLLLLVGSLRTVWNDRHYRNAYGPLREMQHALLSRLPADSYAIFDHEFRTSWCSISLSLLLDDQGLSRDSGKQIGICQEEFCPANQTLVTKVRAGGMTCRMVDLDTRIRQDLKDEGWVLVSPNEVHRMTVEWWKDLPEDD